MDNLTLFLISVSLFTFVNRFCGGGFGWNKLSIDGGGPLRGRPIYYVVIPMLILFPYFFGILGALIAVSFLCWRMPAWYGVIDMGSNTGTLKNDVITFFFRNFFAIPVWLLLIWYNYFNIAAFLVFNLALIASYYIAWKMPHKPGSDRIAVGELFCGVVWGVTSYFILTSGIPHASIS
jgi:hypothetical protein